MSEFSVETGSRVVIVIDVVPPATVVATEEADNTSYQSVLEQDALQCIRLAMDKIGWTQADLARELGVTPVPVSNVLGGHSARGLSLALLERYLAALGWRLDLTLERVNS